MLLAERFHQHFAQEPLIEVSAPARVNLLGEHTDYNDGFVLPTLLRLETQVAAARRSDFRLSIYSEKFNERVEIRLDRDRPQKRQHWSDYIIGVAYLLAESGHQCPGANLLVRSNIPVGSGLSSSAALEVAIARSLLSLCNGETADPQWLAQVCLRAENEFVGARCGIMDQFVVSCGRPGEVLFLDCRSLEHRFLRLPPNTQVVVCDSKVKHSIAAGEYNRRREECETAVRLLSTRLPGIRALRDVSARTLDEQAWLLSPELYERCRHVVSENARVLEGARALEQGDADSFGKVMLQSHRSLQADYQVSCPELDLLVELARGTDGVFGCRMTGGGFGGCTVNLLHPDFAHSFTRKITEGYQAATGQPPEIYVEGAPPESVSGVGVTVCRP